MRSDKIGVSGLHLNAGGVGAVGAGVLEEDRDIEGNDTVHLAVLRLVKCAKPRACACAAFIRDDVEIVV